MHLRWSYDCGRRLLWLPLCGALFAAGPGPGGDKVVIPKTWDDAAMATLELPLAYPAGSPKHVSSEYYYRIPVRPIYKQYPVYAPGREPAGYWEWLKQQDPVIVWDDNGQKPALNTDEDWIKAGAIAFDAPSITSIDNSSGGISVAEVRSKTWYEEGSVPVASNGVVPFFSYVIREKGKVELGQFACGMCHTRVMPDGSILKGAQGNFNLEKAEARATNYGGTPPEVSRMIKRLLWAVPWLNSDPLDRQLTMTPDQLFKLQQMMPSGVMSRHRASPIYPVQVPDLIGVKDRAYLDRTGLQPHRSMVDLMRYAALNQGGDFLANFDGFIPLGGPDFSRLPDPANPLVGGRYSDEQPFALARYVYSLKPPPNPNKMDEAAAKGAKLFELEGCSKCHVPPLYSNNKLTPADGFTVPPGAAEKYRIAPKGVGTDPGLAIKTRRGTGYYKVPSLRGVWYRSMFGHSGWCATLEDWFDPKRLNDDYVPTGFKPNGNAPYPVKGHPFGLDLTNEERKELIAFLKTL
jgi:hypothetical protein